ncbi:DUF4062 domain-containing protein [Breznakiella homolactica]|uniref:DUF4062 domain-containing protein n=1 Tax=Breznakiella homolactica TaxID=2798577 RepID=A0A7T8BA80_9SPIR|nr:DUF4062 domain-containing protein [Breznakiella homolactica]QQO09081.1 DUF4062 domain-containing protein [Breznakiella homolactica]
MMEKKYHVYISSTLDDLKNERHELAKMVIELGHIPVTMDQFDAGDPGQWAFIQKTIDDCDYFLAVAAHKYNMLGDKSSVAEKEYIQARKRGIPVIAMVVADKARKSPSRIEKDKESNKRLNDFKTKLLENPHERWSNSGDLVNKSRGLLIRTMSIEPRTGWVRSDQIMEASAANELGRLSRENAKLRYELKIEDKEIMSRIKVKMKYTLRLLAYNKEPISFFYVNGENWENTRNFRYIKLFKILAPELYSVKTTSELSRFLGNVLNPDLAKKIRKDYPTPSNTVKKIMTDFRAFRIVSLAGENKGDEQWELSEYGKELYSFYRRYQFERTAKEKK